MAYKQPYPTQPNRAPLPAIAPPPQPATPTPYQATGTKGAPIPGQTVPARPAAAEPPAMPPTGPTPSAPPAAAPLPAQGGKPPGISDRAWKSHNEINSNISPEQWQAWDQFADPACPPNMPYRSQKLIGGRPNGACAETPDNCPDGYQAFGRDECRTNAEVSAITGGGGGPGGGGGGPTGIQDPNFPGAGAVNMQDDFLWQSLMDRLKQGSRWNPDTLAQVVGSAKQEAEAQAGQQTEDYNANLAQRGLARSAVGNQGYRDIRANAGNQVYAAKTAILKAKVDADYQDQSDTLAKMQDWLNSRRNAILQSNATQAQKEVQLAQIRLGYAQLEQQMNMLREEYAQKLALTAIGL